MPLMISRIGHARGRPVLFAAGRWGSITRHSLSVTSVWYRFVSRICCIRVVGVHMVSPGLLSATPWNHADPSHSTSFETASYRIARLHQTSDAVGFLFFLLTIRMSRFYKFLKKT